MANTERRLTRREAKELTRRRLLTAALEILDEQGEAGLTTVNVTRRAGVAQSSFYVHFEDVDDLLHSVVDDMVAERRRMTRVARRRYRMDPHDVEALRDTFRVPLRDLIAHPLVFRLLIRSRLERSSPLGEWSRELLDGTRKALVEDLVAAGIPYKTAADRRRAEMVADGIIALTEVFTLGHLDGRYPDIEEIVDMLVTFSRGYFPMFHRPD